MPNWDPVYPELIDWENNPPSTRTPIDEVNLGKGDKALRELDDRVLALGRSWDTILLASGWSTSGGVITYTVNTDFFDDDDHPIAQVWGTNTPETEDEVTQRNYITKIICTSSSVVVYASTQPTVDLKLIMRR